VFVERVNGESTTVRQPLQYIISRHSRPAVRLRKKIKTRDTERGVLIITRVKGTVGAATAVYSENEPRIPPRRGMSLNTPSSSRRQFPTDFGTYRRTGSP